MEYMERVFTLDGGQTHPSIHVIGPPTSVGNNTWHPLSFSLFPPGLAPQKLKTRAVTDSLSRLPRSVSGKNSFENKRITRSIFPEKERVPWNSHESFASSLMTKKKGDPTPFRVAASMREMPYSIIQLQVIPSKLY